MTAVTLVLGYAAELTDLAGLPQPSTPFTVYTDAGGSVPATLFTDYTGTTATSTNTSTSDDVGNALVWAAETASGLLYGKVTGQAFTFPLIGSPTPASLRALIPTLAVSSGGASLSSQGAWSSGTAYTTGQWVTRNGGSFYAPAAIAAGNDPNASGDGRTPTGGWALLAAAGTNGTNGSGGSGTSYPPTGGIPESDFSTALATKVDGAAQKSNNLSDVASAATTRTNLGLGTAATHASTDFDAAGAAAAALTSAETYSDAKAITGVQASVGSATPTLVAGQHNPLTAASNNVAALLPTGKPAGTELTVERTDFVTANTMTITGNIRGVASTSLSLLAPSSTTASHESLHFLADSSGSWWPIAGHKTQTWLDARYAAVPAVGDYYASGNAQLLDEAAIATKATVHSEIGFASWSATGLTNAGIATGDFFVGADDPSATFTVPDGCIWLTP